MLLNFIQLYNIILHTKTKTVTIFEKKDCENRWQYIMILKKIVAVVKAQEGQETLASFFFSFRCSVCKI